MQAAAAIAIRPVEDRDGQAVAALVAACFAEYDGCIYEPAEFPELAAPASWYRPKGTRMWVAQMARNIAHDPTRDVADRAAGLIVGCICATPHGRSLELHKFYVDRRLRGSGLALTLTDLFFGLSRDLRATDAFLWTDTRFARAHRFYEKVGFKRQPETRRLEDISATVEFHYAARLGPDGRPVP